MKRITTLLLLAAYCADAGQKEHTLDGSPTPLEEEIRWLVNRGRYDSARENQLRGTAFTDIPATDGPLAPNHSLSTAAGRHSEDMARNNVFQHATVPGSGYYNASTQPQPWDRIRAEGYSYSSVGENIAAGYSGAEAAYTGWWKSGGHRRNMCNSGYREIGNGHFHWASSTFRNYYTMNLGGRSGQHFLTCTAFHDANGNRAYNQGEGVAGIRIALRFSGADHPDFDISGTSGGFAIPIPSIPAGTRVEVWLSNPTAATVTLTIPRGYDTHETLTLAPGSQALAGTFAKPADTRNIGFRNLTPPGNPPMPHLSITRTGHRTELRWASHGGYRYRPQHSPDLGEWTDLTVTPLAGTGGELAHQHISTAPRGYYRIALEPIP